MARFALAALALLAAPALGAAAAPAVAAPPAHATSASLGTPPATARVSGGAASGRTQPAATAATGTEGPGGARRCTASTGAGRVAGRPGGRLCVFRGIPYAAPPTGPLRFRPPQPAPRWSGTFQATDGSRVCPQFRDDQSEEYPDGRDVYTDEDCLRLNVWTPGPDAGRRPVIVFIHGGAARFGSGGEPRYAGDRLAARGNAVVVTINYRLGVLGWTELGGLDPAYRGSGNNGLRDQIAALAWVRAHIAAFGGDPRDVTAVGESEGAFSIGALLATDHPQRLFRRAVLESGSGSMVHSAALERRLAGAFPAVTGVTSVRRLLDMDVAGILAVQDRALDTLPGAIGGAIYFAPYVDGEVVRGPVLERVAAGHARGIDLIAGSNRDELRYFAQFDPGVLHLTQRDYDGLFPAALAGRRDAMVAAYTAAAPPGASEGDVVLAMLTDQGMRVPATRLLEAQGRWARTYAYRFDWAPPAGLGAIHTAELPFVFGTLRFTGIPGGAEALAAAPRPLAALADRMVTAWTTFARTGAPGRDWPRYRPADRLTMIWDVGTARLLPAPDDSERALWDGYDFAALDLNDQ